MLVYLTSYPRSGNFWSINLIRHYLEHECFSVYYAQELAHRIQELGEEAPVPVSADGRLLLTPSARRRVAEAESCTFVKTHELPFDSYFPGERVIHIVRHPGAALWSYYHFLHEIEHLSVDLEGLIGGLYGVGSWSYHTERWMALARSLGSSFLCYSFEQLYQDADAICREIARFTGLPLRKPSVAFPSIEHWREAHPGIVRSGSPDEWQSHFSPPQLQLLYYCHGKTMRKFSYPVDEALLAKANPAQWRQYPAVIMQMRRHRRFLHHIKKRIHRAMRYLHLK